MQLREPSPVTSGPLQIKELTTPQPGRGEVVIRVSACGVCHTDLHVVEGDITPKKFPITPGHQVIGTIESAGSGSEQRGLVGRRVGVAWLNRTCGMCEYCSEGKENLCVNARFTGYDVDGGFADYILAPDEFIYPIPLGFSDEQAAPLLRAGIVGFRALRLS